jgi:hypothetical protein
VIFRVEWSDFLNEDIGLDKNTNNLRIFGKCFLLPNGPENGRFEPNET